MPRFVYNTYGFLCKFYPRETFLGLKLQGGYVGNILYVPRTGAALPDKVRVSYGAHVLDHLAADGAGFPGGQVTVVTVGQVYADLRSGLHLELVHSLTSLGNVDLIVALHTYFFSFCRFPERPDAFRWKTTFLSVTLSYPGREKL